ncbi:hypothetical protein DL766_002955 [Monosporascus sp. MC13-8B]|nr:hypothetical protein DL766_002955 [Monosporascus sp. MC13-8B]
MFEKPVYVKDLESNVTFLSQDIKSLYSRIQQARHQKEVIPWEVRNQVLALVGEDGARPYSFRREATAGAEAMHTTLCDIKLEAKAAAEDEYHETGWNHSVHTPLLKLVYMSRKQSRGTPQLGKLASARVVSAMSATIWGNYIPIKPSKLPTLSKLLLHPVSDAGSGSLASGVLACSVSNDASSGTGTDYGSTATEKHRHMHSRSDSKRVDYVLVMDAQDDAPLQRVFSHFVYEALERDLLPHVNQTLYRPLQWSPIACSIKTKVETAAQDPMLQLGTWVAAWHKRMHILRQYLFSKAPSLWRPGRQEDRLPSTLLIEVVNHEWRLYFTCDRGASIDLYGPLSIGSTRHLTEAYALVASLEAIKEWIETTFREGMDRWLMCNELLDMT